MVLREVTAAPPSTAPDWTLSAGREEPEAAVPCACYDSDIKGIRLDSGASGGGGRDVSSLICSETDGLS